MWKNANEMQPEGAYSNGFSTKFDVSTI